MAVTGQIQHYMTWIPHAVDIGQPVAAALHRMHTLDVGHLPVLESGRLVGMVWERELHRVSEIVGFNAEAVPVGDVMRPAVCTAPPEAPLSEVIGDMVRQRSDCCAVLDDGHVIGLLTSTDALAILDALLSGRPRLAGPALRPSQVRARILDEHTLLRGQFDELERLAARASADDEDEEAGGLLKERCRALHLTLSRHIELENALLVPALRQTDGFGPHRAELLLAEHAQQSESLLALLGCEGDTPTRELAARAEQLISQLRTDMTHEERALINADLLRDDVIDIASSG